VEAAVLGTTTSDRCRRRRRRRRFEANANYFFFSKIHLPHWRLYTAPINMRICNT